MGATCRDCGEPVLWTTTRKGKKMPVDEDPVKWTEGAVLFALEPDDTGRGFNAHFIGGANEHTVGYIAHWATCPFADNFRSEKPKEEPPPEPPQGESQYTGLYGEKRETKQQQVFDLEEEAPPIPEANPPAHTPADLIANLRALIEHWMVSSEELGRQSREHVGSLKAEFYGRSETWHTAAEVLNAALTKCIGKEESE